MPSLKRYFFIACSLILIPSCFAAESLYTDQPSVTPALAKPGKWAVGVQTLDLVNPSQLSSTDFISRKDRPLTLEVWYPATPSKKEQTALYKNVTRSGQGFELQAAAYRDAKSVSDASFPLIVLSHGYTGYRTIMYYLGEHLASHGYIVAAIDHTDSTNAEIDFAKNSGAGFMSTLLNRARDQQFVLDYFSKPDSTLTNIVNADKAAIIGYSMGGYGAINTVGGCYSFSAESLQAMGMTPEQAAALMPIFNTCNAGRKSVDPRWQAMIALAPWGGEQNVHKASSLAEIEVPMLFIAGDQDDISGFENGIKKLFEQTASKPTSSSKDAAANSYMMVYENARHNIAAHPAPKVAFANDLDIGHHFEPSWSIETLNRINQHMSLAFLNCYLKTDQASCDILPKTEDITQRKDETGKLSDAWPGFAERWGTGVKLFRQ